jgi:hypothetical protein
VAEVPGQQRAVSDDPAVGGDGAEAPVAVEVFATAMAGEEGAEVAERVRELLRDDARLAPDERGGDWAAPPRVEADGDVVRVAAETARAEVLVMMMAGAGGRRIRVCEYPDLDARERWSRFGSQSAALPEGVEARLVDSWGGPPRLLMPTVAALVIAVSLERMGALVWQASLVLFAALAVAVLWLAGRQARYRVEWYRIEQKT